MGHEEGPEKVKGMGETGQPVQVKSSEQCLVPSKHSRGDSQYSCHPLSAGEESYILCGLTDKLELKGISTEKQVSPQKLHNFLKDLLCYW